MEVIESIYNRGVTPERVQKIADWIKSKGLCKGKGNPDEDLCAESLVCAIMDEDHGDRPNCVSDMVCRVVIVLNDLPWSTNMARGRALQKVAIAQLGSFKKLDSLEFYKNVAIGLTKQVLPTWFNWITNFAVDCAAGIDANALEIIKSSVTALREHQVKLEQYIQSNPDQFGAKSMEVNSIFNALEFYTSKIAGAFIKEDCLPSNQIIHLSQFWYYLRRIYFNSAQNYTEYDMGNDLVSALCRVHKGIFEHGEFQILADIVLEALKAAKSPGCDFLHLVEEKAA